MDNLDKRRAMAHAGLQRIISDTLPKGKSVDYYRGMLDGMYTIASVVIATNNDEVKVSNTLAAYVLVLEDKLKEN